MAYRYEGEDLIIDGWERGIADGPYQIQVPSALGPINQTGTVDLSYGNITGVPGEISVEFPLKACVMVGQSFTLTGSLSTGNTSATLSAPWAQTTTHINVTFSNGDVRSTQFTNGNTGITWVTGLSSNATATIAVNFNVSTLTDKATEIDVGNAGTVTTYFVMDGQGQIFGAAISNDIMTWTSLSMVGSAGVDIVGVSGLTWFQGYLIIIYQNKIYYTVDGTSPVDWTSTIGAPISGNRHYALSSQFNPSTMWFCNGAFVAQITVNAGKTFDPTDTSTFTSSVQQVAVPSYDMTTCLAEINDQVLIGSSLNRVYVWDANNLNGSGVTGVVSATLFTGDRFVQRIVVVNTNAYVFTGHPVIPSGRGNIYVTNGSQMDLYRKMPDQIASYVGNQQWQSPFWTFGDAMWHRNKLFFGATVNGVGGVWAIDLNSQSLYRSNLMTTGSSVLVTLLNPLDMGSSTMAPTQGLRYFCASTDGSGDGTLNNTTSTMSTSAVIISDQIPIGTFLNKKTFEQLELKTRVALASGESIDVTVTTEQGSFVVGSMTSSDGVGRVFSPLNFQGEQWLNVKCVLNPTNSSPTYVRLREIRLR